MADTRAACSSAERALRSTLPRSRADARGVARASRICERAAPCGLRACSRSRGRRVARASSTRGALAALARARGARLRRAGAVARARAAGARDAPSAAPSSTRAGSRGSTCPTRPGATPASVTSTRSTRTRCTWTCSGAARCSSSCRRRRRSAARSGWPSWLLAPATADEVRARQVAVARAAAAARAARGPVRAGPRARRRRAPRIRWSRGRPRRRGSAAGAARRRGGALRRDRRSRSASRSRARRAGGRRSACVLLAARRVALALQRARRERARRDRAARARPRPPRGAARAPRGRALRGAAPARDSAPRSTTTGRAASRQIAQLHRLVALLDWRRNQLFAPIAGVLLWGVQLAFALEAWRARSGGDIARWLDAVGDFEALGDLAGYAFEHPADPFPELADTGPLFHARGARATRCSSTRSACATTSTLDARAPARRRLGLEHVGQEHVPAQRRTRPRSWRWPARRCARSSLRLSPLALGACLRVQDSLRDGASRFYAELLALRRVAERCKGPLPVLVPARRDPERHELARPARSARTRCSRDCSRAARSAS